MYGFFLRAAEVLYAAPSPAKDAAYLFLFFAPFAAFFAAFFVYLFKKGLRVRSKSWFLYLAGAFSFASSAFSVFAFGAAAVYGAAASLLQFALCVALYGVLALLCRDKKPKARGRRKAVPEAFFTDDEEPPLPAEAGGTPAEPAEKPRIVRCFSGGAAESGGEKSPPRAFRSFGPAAPARPAKDVRLDYVLSVAERLKELPLGAGDRLEAEKMGELLNIYHGKGDLAPAESQTLNDILAALLKMMAKYDV